VSELYKEETPLFEPDVLLATQYLEVSKETLLDPERKLMLAVLEDAIFCFQTPALREAAFSSMQLSCGYTNQIFRETWKGSI
jgi:hypothetical protein